ncbi:hypothetical protein [Phycobacter sp. K97]|jgi:hypothetical protein|uniref:hypothetical protein n=1 Tax=Phycobacter sedimenti TaxID=3133977 RepID=UPI00311F3B48
MAIIASSVPNLRAAALTQARAGRKLRVVTAVLWRIKIKANLSFQALLDRSGRHGATFWPYQFLKLSLSAEAERPQAFVT